MNCAQFNEWLDQGSPGEDTISARTHADSCSDCAAALVSDRAVTELVSQVATPVPSGFALNVMARIREFEANRAPLPSLTVPDSLPWWVRAAMQPVTVLALVLLSVVLWQNERLVTYAAHLMNWVNVQGQVSGQALQQILVVPSQPWLVVGLVLGFAPLLYMIWLVAFRGALRVTMRYSMARPALARR
jgi:hypothetical protein